MPYAVLTINNGISILKSSFDDNLLGHLVEKVIEFTPEKLRRKPNSNRQFIEHFISDSRSVPMYLWMNWMEELGWSLSTTTVKLPHYYIMIYHRCPSSYCPQSDMGPMVKTAVTDYCSHTRGFGVL